VIKTYILRLDFNFSE